MRLQNLLVPASLFLSAFPASAHFQELIPSHDIVTAETGQDLDLSLTFTHPMENGPVMEMGKPVRFGVVTGGENRELRDKLDPRTVDGHRTYTARYTVAAPGDHVFYVEPAPYWEPLEGKMIVHYTKVAVGAFGQEDGWDASAGFPVEITPLARPYGLWTGNLFRGVVRRDGKPVPFAEIEVEYRSEGRIQAPAAPFVTQVIKGDAQGVFAYAMPKAGWWGFAALVDGPELMTNPDGKPVPVEQGALIWVHTRDMP